MWEDEIKFIKFKNMIKRAIKQQTLISTNESYEGETIEQKVERIMSNKEPIKDGAPLVYTEREEGILPAYDPRTDRWDIAIDAMDKVSQTIIAKREEAKKPKEELKPAEVKPAEPIA